MIDPLTEFYNTELNTSSDIYAHLPGFVDTVRTRDAQQVVEIGVGAGRSTCAWLLGLRDTGGQLWSVDIVPTDRAYDLQRIVPDWAYVIGDSLTVELPPACDILFIDSEHTYEQTLAELRRYIPLVRPGGVALLHDTGDHQPGVRRALDEFGLPWTDDPGCYGLGTIEL